MRSRQCQIATTSPTCQPPPSSRTSRRTLSRSRPFQAARRDIPSAVATARMLTGPASARCARIATSAAVSGSGSGGKGGRSMSGSSSGSAVMMRVRSGGHVNTGTMKAPDSISTKFGHESMALDHREPAGRLTRASADCRPGSRRGPSWLWIPAFGLVAQNVDHGQFHWRSP